ncbi:YbdK family carboxylate-amine ligase [Citricoccus sp. SGAir0253]|uniref:glutamate--cysteine ligase n=1 Tax=Citricoccus sp. SGAir0253 TaxID=2567881 RepID=UPI0010CD3355|nr:glutamate--cysteine ligase [Citricoccus sp. SGAir0253]QCU79109.1 YbdK family carboxylate-amine ligase [Citricoccus sp. SGAir0253]
MSGGDGARSVAVAESLLLVDPVDLTPVSAGDRAVQPEDEGGDGTTGHRLTAGRHQDQVEVSGPPQSSLAGLLHTIRAGREAVERAASRAGAGAVALATAPGRLIPHPAPGAHHRGLGGHLGPTGAERLVNGFRVRVAVASLAEAVSVLDGLRPWLPALLALSANSPFWQGQDTGYASYRYQAASRLPASGPPEHFGSPEAHRRHGELLRATGLPMDPPMLHQDALVREDGPAVEVRVADVCLDPRDAAVLAVLVRALVETTARRRGAGGPPDGGASGIPAPVPASVLRTWCWLASRSGVDDRLIDPATGTPAPAGDVLSRLLDAVRPVLAEQPGEEQDVEAGVADILRRGTGARLQREAFAARQEVQDVVAAVRAATQRAV